MPHEVRRFIDEGVPLSYEIHGTGPKVVLYLHGLLLDSASNRRLAEDLAALGYRVILLDLPGHGRSGKPVHASAHRMDAYARRVIHLMDALGLERAVVGGASLGANVTLQLALHAPQRLQGMLLEMPVLENATPVAAMIFVPLLLAEHYATPVMRFVSSMARRLPRTRFAGLDQLLAPMFLEPDEMAAILHGLLVGPVAPTAEERSAMAMPTLVIGHRADRLHPFSDANKLTTQLQDATLIEAHSILELRTRPARLTGEIASFLERAWAADAPEHLLGDPSPTTRSSTA